MLQKLFYVFLAACFLIVVEAAAAFLMDNRWKPDLCLLMIIFATLSLGFRYGFAAALVAGLLKESLVSHDFGMMLVPYLACVFLADYLKKRLSLHESLVSRLGIVLVCLIVQIFIQTSFFSIHHSVDWLVVAVSIVMPQVLTTIVFSEAFFKLCRPCASRLFV